MTLSIASNATSLSASHRLAETQHDMGLTLKRLSSGLRITSAADDAAGNGVATNLETENRSLRQAMRNTNDAISILQTADAAAAEISDLIIRVHELFTAGASETLDDQERNYLVDEFTEIREEMDRIAGGIEFNGISLNNSTLDAQVGTRDGSDYQITLTIGDMTPDTGLNVPGTARLASAVLAQQTLSGSVKSLDLATDQLNEIRSSIGATMNRLESALSHNQAYSFALESAQANIQDADYAQETAQLSKLQIMQQAGVASLAQAKNINQSAIGLL